MKTDSGHTINRLRHCIKKASLIIIGVCMTLNLTGCDIDLMATFDNYKATIQEIRTRNYAVVEQFFDAGLLTAQERDSLKGVIDAKVKSIENLKQSDNLDMFGGALVSIATDGSNYTTEKYKDPDTGKEIDVFSGTTDPVGDKFKKIGEHALSQLPNSKNFSDGKNGAVQVLKLYDQGSLKSIEDTLNKEVYVLNKVGEEDLTEVVSLLQTIDLKVNEQTNDADKASVLNSYRQSLEKYFIKSDKKIFNFKTEDLVKDTVASAKIGDTDFVNEVGKDVAVSADGAVAATVRIQELTTDAVKKVMGADFNTKKKYLVMDKQAENDVARVYLLEYPVDSITDIRSGKPAEANGAVSSTDWWCDTDYDLDNNGENSVEEDKNKLRVNLMTGQVLNSDNSVMNKEASDKDNFYRVDTVAPSFGWYHPYTSANIIDNSITRVYLKEYLELTYMPGIVGEEPFIATGRRIKINKLSGGEKDSKEFGMFVDKVGDRIPDIPSLDLYDVVDYQSGSNGYYQNVAEKLGLGNDNNDKVKEDLAKPLDSRCERISELAKTSVVTKVDGLIEAETKDKHLFADVYFNWIRPTIAFGNNDTSDDKQILNDIDAQRVKAGELPKLVGLCVNTNMFKTNLFSSWINVQSDDSSTGNIIWWNTWLGKNGYQYKLDQQLLLDSLGDTYRIELNNEGYVILDLEAVSKIQTMMNTDRESSIASNIFTLSKLVGFLFISYSILLGAAWIIDVNFTHGIDFMGNLTMHKWEAVSDMGDMPNINTQDKNYITLKLLIKNCVVIMLIGVVLLFIDIITLRDILLRFVGVFIEVFQRIFNNK